MGTVSEPLLLRDRRARTLKSKLALCWLEWRSGSKGAEKSTRG